MTTLIQDIRYALRQMRKTSGFTAIVILTLSLGIGSATAVFSVIDAVLVRPLPFAHQERLVYPLTIALAGFDQPMSYPSYVDTRAQLTTLEALAGYSGNSGTKINLESPSGSVALQAVKGTDNFFEVFGVKPLLGRTYLPGEDQDGKDNVTVLSYEVWQTQFGGRQDVVGQVVRLDGMPYTVIGVMPASFRFPLSTRNAIYTPLHAAAVLKASRGSHWLLTVGLLKPGIGPQQAKADFDRVLNDLGRAYPDHDLGRTVHLIPLREMVAGKTQGPLNTLELAVLALLAIACVNAAGLLLARGVKREREVALRAAVGAGRWRLLRQMMTESLVLSVAALIAGLGVSWLLLSSMRTFLVLAMSRGQDVHMNVLVLLAALVFSAVTSVAASLAPALRLSGTDPNWALRAGGAAGTGRGQHRLRSGFVITQIALSLTLLIVSGLLLRSLQDQLKTSLGFEPKTILTTKLNLSPGGYEGRDPLTSFYQPLLERITHLPGVQAAGIINVLPIQNYGWNSDVHITGQPPYPPDQQMLAEQRLVSSGYFDAMGIKLLRGRMLSPALDTAANPAGSVVVNEAFRRKFFSNGGDPVGAHIDDSSKAELKTGIVGEITDVRQNLALQPLAEMDTLVDEIDPKSRLNNLASMQLVVRSSGDPMALVASLRNAFHDIDPTVPFQTPQTMTDVVSETLVFERMESWLFGIFAGFALFLAIIGLYGLINHEVELRTRDIGIRMALGSTRSMVLGNVLRRVVQLILTGIALGLLLTTALNKVLLAVVEIHVTHDASLLLALTASFAVVGILAGVLPARRAASIEPMQALRTE